MTLLQRCRAYPWTVREKRPVGGQRYPQTFLPGGTEPSGQECGAQQEVTPGRGRPEHRAERPGSPGTASAGPLPATAPWAAVAAQERCARGAVGAVAAARRPSPRHRHRAPPARPAAASTARRAQPPRTCPLSHRHPLAAAAIRRLTFTQVRWGRSPRGRRPLGPK